MYQNGFRKEEVIKTYKEVLETKREDALQYKNKKASDRVPFVLTFHPRLRKLGTILNRYFYLLQSNERLRKAFPEVPMVAFRRLQNLKDMLVHSGSRKEEVSSTVCPCKNARCKCCSHLEEKDQFLINGKQHDLRAGGSCKSSNVIYGVRCKKCGLWYIGETSMKLHERMNQHRYSTNKLRKGGTLDKSNDTGLSDHFAEKDHEFDRDVELHLLESGGWKSAYDRQQKESFYICRYSTLEPGGLNKKPGCMGDIYHRVNGKI